MLCWGARCSCDLRQLIEMWLTTIKFLPRAICTLGNACGIYALRIEFNYYKQFSFHALKAFTARINCQLILEDIFGRLSSSLFQLVFSFLSSLPC